MANEKMGEYAFLVGVAVAVLAALVTLVPSVALPGGWVAVVLVVLGLVVGFLNISDKESQPFLLAVVALLAAGTVGFKPLVDQSELTVLGRLLTAVVQNLATLVAPAAVILAVKSTWSMASGK